MINTIIEIGYTGVKKCYVNVPRQDAIIRYFDSEHPHHKGNKDEDALEEMDISVYEVKFVDEFAAYDISEDDDKIERFRGLDIIQNHPIILVDESALNDKVRGKSFVSLEDFSNFYERNQEALKWAHFAIYIDSRGDTTILKNRYGASQIKRDRMDSINIDRVVNDLVTKFPDGEERYRKSALFNNTINTLAHGHADPDTPYKLIGQLINMIEENNV